MILASVSEFDFFQFQKSDTNWALAKATLASSGCRVLLVEFLRKHQLFFLIKYLTIATRNMIYIQLKSDSIQHPMISA